MNKELLQKNFEDRGFTVRFFETGAEAKDYLCSKLTARSIGFGGSVTLKELGLYEALSEKNVVVWHHRIWGDEIKDLASHAKNLPYQRQRGGGDRPDRQHRRGGKPSGYDLMGTGAGVLSGGKK